MKMSEILQTIFCVIRLHIFMPLILVVLCFVPIMYILGVKDPIDKWIRLNEGIVFNTNDNEQITKRVKKQELFRSIHNPTWLD